MQQPKPIRVGDLGSRELGYQLQNDGLPLQIGPALIRVRSPVAGIRDLIELLYRDYPLAPGPSLADAELELRPSRALRRWTRPQIQSFIDGRPPFEPLPLKLAYPMLEWSMNWCIASRLHQYFMIHAAVVERENQAIILPAWSGSGKSTLCAALVQHGWRLLSDEFCLLSLADGDIMPVPRPIPLKNEAITAFREFSPDSVIGPTFFQTRKGDIAHLRPPLSALENISQPARPRWIVLPRYRADGNSAITPVESGRALLLMSANSFNFNLLGAPAFDALSHMMSQVSCHKIVYSDLNQAVTAIESLSKTSP